MQEIGVKSGPHSHLTERRRWIIRIFVVSRPSLQMMRLGGRSIWLHVYRPSAASSPAVDTARAERKEVLPEAYDHFIRNINLLEKHFGDMQDVEFTVERGKLWMLQCRSGKRTGPAAFNIAVDMVKEGLCSKDDALLKIDPDHVKQVLHPSFSKESLASPLYRDNIVAKGLAGGPGAAVGKLVFTTAEAEARSSEQVILVREVTSPEDVGGMWAAQGILTARGGITSRKFNRYLPIATNFKLTILLSYSFRCRGCGSRMGKAMRLRMR